MRQICLNPRECSGQPTGFDGDALHQKAEYHCLPSRARTRLANIAMSSTILIKVLSLPVLALCAILPLPSDTGDTLQELPTYSALSSPGNSSALSGNNSISTRFNYKCDWVRYGRGLKVESCKSVFNFIKPDNVETVYADRSSAQHHDVDLPVRATSSKWLNDWGSRHSTIL